MNRFPTLDAWLEHIEKLHATPIDLGLDRMYEMIRRMEIAMPCPLITVGGTNGKGSTCTMLERIYRAAGYKTGLHMSPHLVRFNERCLINGEEVADDVLMAAFAQVEDARGDMTLSYFEYTALAIMRVFQEAKLDVAILEVGLGGRLDAVNALDADAAIVTTIGIDHTAFLGDTREAIALEKAHIYRPNRPAVCADPMPPATLVDYAKEIGADLRLAHEAFDFTVADTGAWSWKGVKDAYEHLPAPGLAGVNQYANASGVLAVVEAMQTRLPVSREAIETGLTKARVTGRFECVEEGDVRIVLDVGHNPHAAKALAQNILSTKREGERTLAVCGMLADKDMAGVGAELKGVFDEWFLASLTGPRAASAGLLEGALARAGVDISRSERFPTVAEALAQARFVAKNLTEARGLPVRIIVFGSFVTVTAAIEALHL